MVSFKILIKLSGFLSYIISITLFYFKLDFDKDFTMLPEKNKDLFLFFLSWLSTIYYNDFLFLVYFEILFYFSH